MNLLRTIISSLVNKTYYHIVILFLCLAFPFSSKDFVFSLLRWSILDFKLERIKKVSKIFPCILCWMDKWNFFLSTNEFLFDVFTILIHYFVSLQYPQSKKEILCQKKKQYSVKLHDFFCILCRIDILFKRLIIYQSDMKIICYSAIQFSI